MKSAILYASVFLATACGYLIRQELLHRPFRFLAALHISVYITMCVFVLVYVGRDLLDFIKERGHVDKQTP